MYGTAIAAARKENFTVIKRLLSYPIHQIKPVGALVLIRNTVTCTFTCAAAMLIYGNVAVVHYAAVVICPRKRNFFLAHFLFAVTVRGTVNCNGEFA